MSRSVFHLVSSDEINHVNILLRLFTESHKKCKRFCIHKLTLRIAQGNYILFGINKMFLLLSIIQESSSHYISWYLNWWIVKQTEAH